MRNLMLAATAAIALVLSPSAFAQGGVDGTVDISGSVALKCMFTTASDTVTIAELADTDGSLDETSVNSQTATLTGWCNGTASTIEIEASALVNTTTAPTGFDNSIDYTATATAHPDGGDVAVSDSTTGAADTPEVVGIFTSNIDITFSSASATGLLVAGDYDGEVVVTLTPAD